MKTFVVRIYRQPKEDEELLGLVEPVGDESPSPFQTFDQLREILMAPSGHEQRQQGNRRRRRRRGRALRASGLSDHE